MLKEKLSVPEPLGRTVKIPVIEKESSITGTGSDKMCPSKRVKALWRKHRNNGSLRQWAKSNTEFNFVTMWLKNKSV